MIKLKIKKLVSSVFHAVSDFFKKSDNNRHRSSIRMYALMRVNILLFSIVLGLGFVISFMLPLRPTESENEKRELSKFPKFSWQALLSGEYFDGIGIWYSDTFPGRDGFIALNHSVQELYIGRQQVLILGAVEIGDEIPDIPSAPGGKTLSVPESDDTPAPAMPLPESEPTKPDVSQEPEPPVIEAAGDTQHFSAVLLAGDAAYEYYNFSQSDAETYVSAVSRAADELSDTAAVYDIIIPTSIGITLPDSLKKEASSDDQAEAIDYMYGSMSSNVKTVNIFDILMHHRDEYIYFRTDHHWTALGAYYAYTEYCACAGLTPLPLEHFETVTDEGYLGSFFSSASQASALSSNPDTLTAYIPQCDNTMMMTQRDGQTIEWSLVNDPKIYSAGMKYSVFIGGDNPYTVITNNDRTDDSSVAVVKESFGNAFVPFLVEHYKTVYVIDYRYWDGDLTDWAKETDVENVIFMNNISATRSSTLMGYVDGII